jgi:hypothetical protein
MLDGQVEHDGGRFRAREPARRLHDLRDLEVAAPRHLPDVHLGERAAQCLEVARVFAQKLRVDPALGRRERRREAEEQVGVGAGADPQMDVGLARRLGIARVDHDHGAARVRGEPREGVVRVVAAVADARVRPHHQHVARVREVGVEEGRGRSVEHPLVHQEVLRLLLRQGIEPALRPEGREEGEAVGRVHVVRLPADPNEADRPGRVLLPDRAEPPRDLRRRRLPGDPLEPAAPAAAQWVLDALGVIYVMSDGEALVADVAPRDGVGFVGADGGDASAFDVDANAAVVAAEDADAGEITGIEGDGASRDGRIDEAGCVTHGRFSPAPTPRRTGSRRRR